MAATDSPLTERLTLFWHGYFTSSLRKVKSPTLLLEQNLLLRRHALGNFKELLLATARDPAMIRYLDNASNRKGEPNENYARELLELFTLGEGRYSERDVQEAARAFTGWTLDRRTGRFRFVATRHDTGRKTFLGVSGSLGGEDIIDIILRQPAAAEHVTSRVWDEFVGGEIPPAEQTRLASLFRRSGYELKPLFRALLLSPAFRDPHGRGSLLKSPTDLVVGTVRVLDLPVRDGRLGMRLCRSLGQDLFDPPNVKGWPGGEQWISSTTLLARRRLLEEAAALLPPTGMTGVSSSGQAAVLLAHPPVDTPSPELSGRELTTALLLDPAYQLK
jgi:uncharacterized protein (DUF1800 family)